MKTSRDVLRFRGGKRGYSWAPKREQWLDPQFNYLVCVLADKDPPQALALTGDEVRQNFTTTDFTRSNTGKREYQSKRLDLIDGGLEAFEANVEAAKKVLKWKGTPTKFERDFNRDPGPFFARYTLERMYMNMKRTRPKSLGG